MTVTTTANSITYAGNGTTTAFAYPYVFFAPSDLVVTLLDSATNLPIVPDPVLNGAATYDYTVTGVVSHGEYASGGTVTFNTAPIAGNTVSLVRAVPATQLVTLIDNTKFPADTVNTEFDKLTVLAQQTVAVTTGLNILALQIPVNEAGLAVTAVPAATRANTLLSWDSLGNLSTIDTASLIGGSVPAGPAGGGLTGSYPNLSMAPSTPIVTVFTGSGTWTPNAKMLYAEAVGWGGGGAGGGCAVPTAGQANSAGGGAGGSWARKFVSKAAAGSGLSVTIGAGAALPALGNVTGGTGGDTSLGAILVAKGGLGGGGQPAAGSGGAGGLGVTAGNVGDMTGPGMSGGSGYVLGGATANIQSGRGGDAPPIGTGGRRVAITGAGTKADGESGVGFAVGGSGGMSFTTTSRGAAGLGGYVVIVEYCSA